MLAERGWFTENMERAREVERVAAVSSTNFIDLTSEDVMPANLLDFEPPQSQPQPAPSWRFESRRSQATEQESVSQEEAVEEKAVQYLDFQEKVVQEIALKENFAHSERLEESTKLHGKEEVVQEPFVKEETDEKVNEERNVEPATVIDLDTYDDAEDPSPDMSMALVVVPDPQAEETVNHNTELAIVRVDEEEASQSNSGPAGPAAATELNVARQCPPGNGQVQAPKEGEWVGGEWVGPPRWYSTTVGILSVQCARCLKWRVVPTREKYEEIREHLLETPWVCENGRDWRPDAHCGLPADLNQDSESVWAIDKPNLPSSPPGWSRKVVVRRDCSTRFADVYYNAPDGKSLRSSVEVAKYLEDNPGSVPPGTTISQFSFTSPRPLPGVWVARKRNKTKSLDMQSSSQECKKPRTGEPLARQLSHKLLQGTPPPMPPAAPSFPSFSAQTYPLPVGASFPGPSLGPDLVQFVAMETPSYPPARNFPSAAPNVPMFTSAVPIMQCAPPPFQPHQGMTSNARNPTFGPGLSDFMMKHPHPQPIRQRGALPRAMWDLDGSAKVKPWS